MTGLPRLASFVIPSWVKIAAPIGIALLCVVAFFIWLSQHDRGVIKRDNDALNAAAAEQGQKAGAAADANQAERLETFNASQDALRNASGVSDYLERLRAQQDRERASTAR